MTVIVEKELDVLRTTARRFAAEQIAPHALAWDREAYFPDAMIPQLAEQGYMGILVPEIYGGAGGTYAMFAIILEALARHDGGLALAVEAHNGLCCQHILLAGNEEQKGRYLTPLAQGEQIGSWCLTEPNSGSDAVAMQTRAQRDGDGWVLNGTKQFITNGARAGTFLITGVSNPDSHPRGISTFIVLRDTPGLRTGKKEEKLGMRSSDTVQVVLDNVHVPPEQVLGVIDHGFQDVKKVLEKGRVMISAISLGLARGGFEEAARYAHQRKAFGKKLSEFQSIQNMLADMATQIEAGSLMVERYAARQDDGLCTVGQAAMTKLFTSEMATRVCMDAIQVLGGYGYLRDYHVERYMRDAKLCEIGEGTSEIMRILIARSIESLSTKI